MQLLCVPDLYQGEPCLSDGECASGHCVDGVCCDRACDSVCESCNSQWTGGPDGQCGFITEGLDPEDECTGEEVCDGLGACILRTAAPIPGSEAARLDQNVPNPFNPLTTIRYRILRDARVSLRVYDAGGRLVRCLRESLPEAAGSHAVIWDGRDRRGAQVVSGVYFCRLQVGRHSLTRPMLVLR